MGVGAEGDRVTTEEASSICSSELVADTLLLSSIGSSAGRASVQRKKSTDGSSLEASIAASTEARFLLSVEAPCCCGSCASCEVLIAEEAGTRGGGEEDLATSSLGPLAATEEVGGSSAVLFLLSVDVDACCLRGGRGGVEVEAFLINTCLSSRPR